jgi:hypothetical protein
MTGAAGSEPPHRGGGRRVLLAVAAAVAVLGVAVVLTQGRDASPVGEVSSRLVEPTPAEPTPVEGIPDQAEVEPPEESGLGDPLPVPAAGEVATYFLDDGSPVFVLSPPGGDVAVLDARSPVDGWPFVPLVGWCESSQLFEDRPSGSRFLPDGAWLAGPAAGGLGRYPAELTPDGTVQITGSPEPQPRPEQAAEVEHPGPACTDDPAQPLTGHHADVPGEPPEPLREREGPTMVLVTGRLEALDGVVRLCSAGDEPGRRCGDDALAVASSWSEGEDPDLLWAWSGSFVLTLDEGRAVEVQATAAVAEHTGYISGERTYLGTLQLEPPEGAFVEVVGGDPELFLVDPERTVGFAIRDGTTIVAGPALASVSLIPVMPDDLRAFVASGAAAGVPFTVTVDKPTGAVVRIREGG